MERQELQDYLEIVFNLESQVYTYEQIEKKYNEKISSLNEISMPEISYGVCTSDNHMLTTKQYTHCPAVNGKDKLHWMDKPGYHAVIKECKVLEFKYKLPYLFVILATIFLITSIPQLFMLFVSGAILALLLCYNIKYKNCDKVVEAKIKAYFENCYRKEAEKKLGRNQVTKQHLIEELKEKVLEPKAKVKELLQKVYSKNIIYPKYRKFIAVAQIYEYFLSKRVDELEGPFGAYNLFEDELRHDIIIDKLDVVIDKLDEIIDEMRSLGGAITATNNLLEKISHNMGNSTTLNVYNTQCYTYNSSIMYP